MGWPSVLLAIVLAGILFIAVIWWDARRKMQQVSQWKTGIQHQEPAPSHPPEVRRFTAAAVQDLPDAAQRYLRWSIAEGVPLARGVTLKLVGRIRLGRGKPWISLTSEETFGALEGFVWTARTTSGLPLSGYDRYLRGEGEMHWRLFGLVPVMAASGGDITRSARWRFAAEHVFVPSLLLPGPAVRWSEDGSGATSLQIEVDGVPHGMQLTIDPDGMPRKLIMNRWGNVETPGGKWQPIPYAVRLEGVFRSGGYSLPHQMQASWWAGTPNELAVVELEIEQATFF